MEFKKYFQENFIYDAKAGFITGIVALPLAIAFAIASGVPPIMGLYTAVIAGMITSIFGGSTFSITGPTGAMTVIILATVNKFGLEGLMLAGFLAGLFQLILGAIKLGKLIKYIPLPIVSGFTAGIGIIIFIGQIPNFFGLSIPTQEHVWQMLLEIAKNINSASIVALMIAVITILLLVFLPKLLSRYSFLKNIPASIIALVLSTAAAYFFSLPVPQVGSIPSQIPSFSTIKFNITLIYVVLPAAFTIAMLGSIESLLCAVVCDGMTNTKHNSNRELVAHGFANMALPFFGAIPATAAIARSAVNVKEGARTRFSCFIHSVFILITILFIGPVARYIPKAFLAGILIFVSVKMINIHEIKTIMHISRSETIVLFITLLLTVFTDLVFAVQVGMVLAVFLLTVKFSNVIDIKYMEDYDQKNEINTMINGSPKFRENIGVYTMNGPFFFGAMNIFETKLDQHMHAKKPFIILRMKHVAFIDSTAIVRLNSFLRGRQKKNSHVFLSTVHPKVKKTLFRDEEFVELINKEHMFDTTQEAIEYIRKEYLEKTPAEN